MNDLMISTEQLTKKFEQVVAIDHLNWKVPTGSICGLLGPNGAGKTTTLKVLLGITRATSGSAKISRLDAVKDTVEIRRMTAFLNEDKLIYEAMKVREFLTLHAKFFPDTSEQTLIKLLRQWNIAEYSKIRSLSKGDRSKLLLAAALARDARLLLLDEPTDSMDPESVEQVLALLTEWASTGNRTAVIASHRLDEIERICDRVSIIVGGNLLVDKDLDDLRKSWKTIHAIGDVPVETLLKIPEVHQAKREGISINIIVSGNSDSALEKLKQYHVSNIEKFDMNLREIYLSVTRRKGGNHGFAEKLV